MSEEYPILNPMSRGRQCKCKECNTVIGVQGTRVWYQPSADRSTAKTLCAECAQALGWSGEDKPIKSKSSDMSELKEVLKRIEDKLDKLLGPDAVAIPKVADDLFEDEPDDGIDPRYRIPGVRYEKLSH